MIVDPSVSIHAPVRGATREVGSVKEFVARFNPRPRAGERDLDK